MKYFPFTTDCFISQKSTMGRIMPQVLYMNYCQSKLCELLAQCLYKYPYPMQVCHAKCTWYFGSFTKIWTKLTKKRGSSICHIQFTILKPNF